MNGPYDWSYTSTCFPCKQIMFESVDRYVSVWGGIFCDDSKLNAQNVVTEIHLQSRGLSGEVDMTYMPTYVTYVDISNNQLSGTLDLAAGFSQNLNITELHVEKNAFLGGNAELTLFSSKLTDIDLSSNQFEANIEQVMTAIGGLSSLTEANFSYNDFAGNASLDLLPNSCEIFDISHNNIEGLSIIGVSAMSQLSEFDASFNVITSSINLNSISDSMVTFNIGNNAITGTVSNMSNINLPSSLESLDISNNQFGGTIGSLNNFPSSLSYAFLGNNSFVGPVDFKGITSSLRRMSIDKEVYCARNNYYYYYNTTESSTCILPIGPDRKRDFCTGMTVWMFCLILCFYCIYLYLDLFLCWTHRWSGLFDELFMDWMWCPNYNAN